MQSERNQTQCCSEDRDPNHPITTLMGVEIDCVTLQESILWVCEQAQSGTGGFVVTVNLDHLRRCKLDPSYMNLVKDADLVVADGMPLVWASRVQGEPLVPERVAGSTMTVLLCEEAAKRGLSIYLLGGDEGVAERAAETLRQKYPAIEIAGYHCPPFGFEQSTDEMTKIRDGLIAASPDIVLVALGSPKQERLIQNIRSICPQACWLGVGISLSFLTGDVVRAPGWMQRFGLEWVHRLIQEPKRLFKRYIIHGIPWGVRLMLVSLFSRFKRVKTSERSV